jgi:hypothetical protein
MKTSSKKAKGRSLQYWVCNKIAELYEFEFDQQNDQCPIHSRDMGQSGTDVLIRDKQLYESFKYDVECKNTETISVYSYIDQAKANTKEGRNWAVIHKKNKSKPIVIIDADHFFNLLKQIRGKKID